MTVLGTSMRMVSQRYVGIRGCELQLYCPEGYGRASRWACCTVQVHSVCLRVGLLPGCIFGKRQGSS